MRQAIRTPLRVAAARVQLGLTALLMLAVAAEVLALILQEGLAGLAAAVMEILHITSPPLLDRQIQAAVAVAAGRAWVRVFGLLLLEALASSSFVMLALNVEQAVQ